MGFDNECIINIQSLKGEYFCPVCRLLVYPNEALQSQCSHLYCKPCLTYIVRTTQACPYDGYLVTEADSKPLLESNKVLADTIGKIPVNCLFHRSGCTWKGNLAECKSHCSGCPFGDSSVMCNRCAVQIVHRQVEEHAQNCSGVQAQAPQSDNGQVTSGATSTASSNQNQTAAPTTTPASQAQVGSVTSASVQKSAQQVNPATQPQAAQVAVPNTEQWYQQQQQYQQYYQQYSVYGPYQQQLQQYQQYNPYQQQAAQQFQQPAQVYSSQVPVQQQAQPSHPPQQLQQPPHALPTAQSQSHPPQATPNVQQQVQPAGQPQTLPNQVAYAVPQSQPQAYSQVQPYAHPQTVPQQGMQMPPYQQTRPQMQQPPHPQVQNQPYPQPQAQHYAHPQIHPPAQAQTYPHPINHNMSLPPPQPTQPVNQAGPPQAHNAPAQAVTGYQSYQQAQALPAQQTQAGVPHSLHVNGLHQQPLNSGQFQGQYSQQPAQVRPSHIPSITPNNQPTMVPSQGQNTGVSVAQVPVYPQSRHPGYPVQHPSGMQPVHNATAQPQGFPGHGPYAQQHPAMQAPVRALAPGQAYQQNSTHVPPIQPNARPMMSHGGGQQPYSQASGLTNAAHLLPTQPSTNQASMNQSYPSVHGQELLKPSVAGMPGAQNMGKGKQEQNNAETGSGNTARVGTSELLNTEVLKPKLSAGSDGKASTFENGTPQKGNVMIKEGTMDNATELASASDSAGAGKKDGKENEQRSDKGFNTSALPPVSSVSAAKQIPGSDSFQSSDPGRNHPQFIGQPPGQLRPQVPGKMHPSHAIHLDNSSGALFGSSSVAPYESGSGSLGMRQGHMNQGKIPGRPPFVSPPPGTRVGITGGARPDFHEGNIRKQYHPNSMEGPGVFFDGRHPELHPHGSMEQRPFGQTQSLHIVHDERTNLPPEEQLKPFPAGHNFGRMDFERDLQKFPRPSHLEGGPRPRFPPAGSHDQGDRFKPAGVHDVRPGFPDFPRPGPGFGHHGSAARDFRANDSHSYPPGKSFRESRFPGLSGQLQRGEFDGPINMHGSDHMITGPRKHSRHGDAMGHDMLPMHSRRGDFGPHSVHSREAAGPGGFRGHLERGEPPFPGSYLTPRPFAEPLGREMPGFARRNEPGFRGRFTHDDGFYRGEMEPFDNPRKRKYMSVMCRICNVDCETVEGLDLHSQTREHQKKAMDMVISIKQQHSKKQKVSNHRPMHEEGLKNRTAVVEGQGKNH